MNPNENLKKECPIVRDLLPGRMDQLTSEQTNQFIDEHLKQCPECRKYYEQMQAKPKIQDENAENIDANDAKAAGWMKKVRRKSRVLTGIIVCLVVVIAVVCFGFWNSAQNEKRRVNASLLNVVVLGNEADDQTVISLTSYAYDGFSAADSSMDGDTMEISLKAAVDNDEKTDEVRFTLPEGTKEVYVNKELIWSQGTVITDQARGLFDMEEQTAWLEEENMPNIQAVQNISSLIWMETEFGTPSVTWSSTKITDAIHIELCDISADVMKDENRLAFAAEQLEADAQVLFEKIPDLNKITFHLVAASQPDLSSRSFEFSRSDYEIPEIQTVQEMQEYLNTLGIGGPKSCSFTASNPQGAYIQVKNDTDYTWTRMDCNFYLDKVQQTSLAATLTYTGLQPGETAIISQYLSEDTLNQDGSFSCKVIASDGYGKQARGEAVLEDGVFRITLERGSES